MLALIVCLCGGSDEEVWHFLLDLAHVALNISLSVLSLSCSPSCSLSEENESLEWSKDSLS